MITHDLRSQLHVKARVVVAAPRHITTTVGRKSLLRRPGDGSLSSLSYRCRISSYRAMTISIIRGETYHHHHHHQSLNREGRWGTTDDFATSFLHFSLFSTALWDSLNSRPVHTLMLSSHLFLSLPCLLPPFTVPCKMVLARPDERES